MPWPPQRTAPSSYWRTWGAPSGEKHPDPKKSSQRWAGIVPGAVTGAAFLAYLSHWAAPALFTRPIYQVLSRAVRRRDSVQYLLSLFHSQEPLNTRVVRIWLDWIPTRWSVRLRVAVEEGVTHATRGATEK